MKERIPITLNASEVTVPVRSESKYLSSRLYTVTVTKAGSFHIQFQEFRKDLIYNSYALEIAEQPVLEYCSEDKSVASFQMQIVKHDWLVLLLIFLFVKDNF